jgi:hypothetical protein
MEILFDYMKIKWCKRIILTKKYFEITHWNQIK